MACEESMTTRRVKPSEPQDIQSDHRGESFQLDLTN
jgi:hypothetical protein